MLRDIEEEEMNASMERVVKKQEVLRETSYLIGGIAILLLIIVVVFIILITRDIPRASITGNWRKPSNMPKTRFHSQVLQWC